MPITYDAIGFIGLGAMGFPMAQNLAKKLPSSTQLHVFDVANDAMERLSEESGDRVSACHSAKEVAEKSVSAETQRTSLTQPAHPAASSLTNTPVRPTSP